MNTDFHHLVYDPREDYKIGNLTRERDAARAERDSVLNLFWRCNHTEGHRDRCHVILNRAVPIGKAFAILLIAGLEKSKELQ